MKQSKNKEPSASDVSFGTHRKTNLPVMKQRGAVEKKIHIAVVGAGASGLAAAIEAARSGASVTVFEGGKKPGQKLLRTGAGRCNLSNTGSACGHYFGRHPAFADTVSAVFPEQELEKWFRSVGIMTVSFDGLKYPASEQARSVLDALLSACALACVRIQCGEAVISVKKEGPRFKIKTFSDTFFFDRVILSCGSRAQVAETAPDGYALAEGLGMKLIPQRAVLVPLTAYPERRFFFERNPSRSPENGKTGYSKTFTRWNAGADREFSENTKPGWDGVRAHAGVTLISGGKPLAHENGQIQFIRGGVSGIAVFNLSPFAVMEMEKKRPVLLEIDLAPSKGETELQDFILGKSGEAGSLDELFATVIPYRLIPAVLAAAGFSADGKLPSGEKAEDTAALLTNALKHFRLHVTGSGALTDAQAALGGVDTAGIDPRTMMSRDVPGLFVTGEMLDIIGICGGFNLRFAWSTGILAGRNAALRVYT